MPTVIHTRLSRPHQSFGSRLEARERTVRRLGALIFAELLPQITARTAHTEGVLPHHRGRSGDPVHTPTTPAREETVTMRAYRTESRYYFSSKQLLPAGSLVFFSDKHRRYVHPEAGMLLDPHPRLQSLSDAESQQLQKQWQEALSRF
jgi:hypothetical protein